jgi:hypothetical protein
MNAFLWALIVALVTWTLTNAYWADRSETEVNELWVSFYNEMSTFKQKQKEQSLDHYKKQKNELRRLRDQSLDLLDEFKKEYDISDSTVFALRMDFERAFGKLNIIHTNEGENNGDYPRPNVG